MTRTNELFKAEAPLKFRARGADIVPYITLAPTPMLESNPHPLQLPIRRIVTGPGVDYVRNASSIERLLAAHGYKDVEIVPSTIPFRT